MKKLILNNWAAKIGTLTLATTLWFLINKKLESSAPLPSSAEYPPAPVPQPQADIPYITVPNSTEIPSPTKSPHAKPNH